MIVGLIGATGYSGAELVRLLSQHPKVSKMMLSSVSFEGQHIEDIYPNFFGRVCGRLLKPEEVIAASDVVFSALPHAVGEPFAQACMERGVNYIDLSADFRFDDDEDTFSAWYGKGYAYPEIHKKSIYGLVEMNRRQIKELAAKGALIIANPGCYPTGASLGVFPALAKGLVLQEPQAAIIVNAVTGITGGGREPARSYHYPECADSVCPYKVGAHRHTPEIARNIAAMASMYNNAPSGSGHTPALIFTPHLAPINRGILSTIYIPLSDGWRVTPDETSKKTIRPPSKEIEEKAAKIHALYADFYKNEPFVRVLPMGHTAATNRVRQSNYCDISVHLDRGGSTLIIASAIDNMLKGASGQAVQNMNIIFGFDETEGLQAIPALF